MEEGLALRHSLLSSLTLQISKDVHINRVLASSLAATISMHGLLNESQTGSQSRNAEKLADAIDAWITTVQDLLSSKHVRPQFQIQHFLLRIHIPHC